MIDLTKLLMASAGATGATGWTIVGTASGRGTVNFPAGYQAGDYVLALAKQGSFTASGWSVVMNGSISSVLLLAGITNQTNFPGPTLANALVVLRPVNVPTANMPAGVILEEIKTAQASYGSNGNNPAALTTTTNGNIIFAMLAWNRAVNTYTSDPTGYTNAVTFINNTDNDTVAIAYKAQPTAGTEDPSGFIFDSAGSGETYTLSLRSQAIPGLVVPSGTFATQTAYTSGVTLASNAVTVTTEGGSPLPISISGGISSQYRINGGAWTSTAGTISNGNTVEVRANSPSNTVVGTVASSVTTLTIGTGGLAASLTYTVQHARELVLIGQSTTFTVPSGVTALNVRGTGGGGAGGSDAGLYYGGGGGGGGAMSLTPSLAVSAGQVLTITAGIGGILTAGGDSSIVRSGSTIWLAKGGSRGGNATTSSSGSGGAGGAASSSTGTTRNSGGAGGSGTFRAAGAAFITGGGGGAGGYTGAGGTGGNATGVVTGNPGTAGSGGAGGGGASGTAGGGTGVSGAGANGAAGGGEGSPDIYATAASGTTAGVSGGGGSGGGGAGGAGVIRIVW